MYVNVTFASCLNCVYRMRKYIFLRSEIKLHGRPPETPIRNLVQHILVASPPLVPFTEEPLSLVGNPASWVSLMCLLCLEILNRPVELVTCGSIVCSKCCCAWLEVSHESLCPC